jgi:predicted NodU family carbamoyl transferase
MVVVGITGRRRRAATAVAVDGRILAAVGEAIVTRVPAAGYRDAGFPIASLRTCLGTAGLTPDSVDVVVSAEGGMPGTFAVREPLACAARSAGLERAVLRRTSTLEACARQAAIGMPAGVVLTTDLQRSALAVATIEEGCVSEIRPLFGLAAVLGLTPRLGRLLGLTDSEPEDLLQSLELLARSIPHESAFPFDDVRGDREASDGPEGSRAFDRALARAAAEAGGSLSDAASPRVEIQRARARVAEGFLGRLAFLLISAAGTHRHSTRRVVLAGSLFACPDFNARLFGDPSLDLSVAPAPAPEGAALGAALQPFAAPGNSLGNHLALGPSFTESDAKKALENCRLDYVYEPFWPRLIDRIVQVLSQGKLVAWFQESAEFGHPVLGSRSVLADPSNRYARDNINRFFRHRPDDWPIGLSVPLEASGCLDPAALSPWRFARTSIRPEWRDRLRGVTDRGGSVHAHVLQPGGGMFHELLVAHSRRTGIPGLINVALHGSGEPTACSPRDAVRATYASAVDAMVMHRFLVMKDYWQLRNRPA